jgi:hypothetical protein
MGFRAWLTIWRKYEAEEFALEIVHERKHIFEFYSPNKIRNKALATIIVGKAIWDTSRANIARSLPGAEP